MKYALLIYESPELAGRRNDPELQAAGMAYGAALRAAGILVTGAGLQTPQTAKTVSVRGGKRLVHDGPFVETKELLGGFVIIDVPDTEAALEWAARHPTADLAAVEVRPVSAASGH